MKNPPPDAFKIGNFKKGRFFADGKQGINTAFPTARLRRRA